MEYKLQCSFGEMQSPPKDNELIYHYCSMESFVNIVKSKEIWFGNLDSMNDPMELYLSKKNVVNKIIEIYNNECFEFEFGFNGVNLSLKDYLDTCNLESVLTNNGKSNNHFFALCLTKKEDDLSQWRLYGDDGQGVCLGFTKSKIEKFVEKKQGDFQIIDVEYKNLEEVEYSVAQSILSNIKGMYDKKDIKSLYDFMFLILDEIIKKCPKYKTREYKDEQEIRIVQRIETENIMSNGNAVDFGDKEKQIELKLLNNKLISYVPVSLNELGLETITLGPTNRNQRDLISLLLAKNDVDVKAKEIYKSKIPYRKMR